MRIKSLIRGVLRHLPKSIVDNKPELKASPSPIAPTIYPDDIFIVSYPKSGNTWLRFLIANYLSEQAVDFVGLHKVMPDMHLDPSLSEPALSRPRFVKSHGAFDSLYPRVVYILRDPRDVAVSSYFHHRKFNLIEKQVPFKQFLQTFIDIGFYPSGPWHEHVESWISSRRDSVLLVTYEAMLADPGAILTKVIEFSDANPDQERVALAVERSSFARMREIEDAQHDEYFKRYGSDTTELRFVREGRAGTWRDFFGVDDLKAFMDRYGPTMRKVGYE